MSTTVTAYWPGITGEQMDDQPSLSDDGHAWGNWMVEWDNDPDIPRAITALGAAPLLTTMTDGWEDDDVTWATPQELRDAAQRLARAVRENRPGVARLLDTFGRNAGGFVPLAEEFLNNLEEIATLAIWAEAHGTDRLTLSVSF